MTYGASTPEDVRLSERRDKVMQMRVAGFTLKQIAKAVGVSHETVRKDISLELMRVKNESADAVDELRLISHERLEALIRRLWNKVHVADPKAEIDYHAVDRMMRAIATHARIMGYEAPQKRQVDMRMISMTVAPIVDSIIAALPDEHAEAVRRAVVAAMADVERTAAALEGAA